MSVSITIDGVLDPITVAGDHNTLLADLNVAAAQGKQFVLVTEEGGPYGGGPAILETRSIRIGRSMEKSDAFIS
jgi:phage protein U